MCDGCGGTYTIKAFAKAVILGFGARNPRSARTFYWYGNVATLIFYLVSLTSYLELRNAISLDYKCNFVPRKDVDVP